MATGIPLPKVVADTEAGGGLVTAMSGMNALANNMLKTKYQAIQNQYAPYTAYADAASKIAYAHMLPYQVQATVMSNPMLWQAMKDNPGAMQDMMTNFVNSVPQGNQILNGLPMPQQSSGGLLKLLKDKLMGKSDEPEQNPLNAMPGSNMGNYSNPMAAPNVQSGVPNPNALVPAAQGGLAGIAGKMTAGYNTSPYKAGSTFVDPASGRVVSAPSSKTTSAAQQQLLAAQRVEPQLDRIADEWAPFLTLKGKAHLLGSKVGNFVGMSPEALQKAGIDTELPSKYAKAQSTTLTAPEALIKAFGLNPTNETLERLQQAIEPHVGETRESYKARIKRQLQELREEQISKSQSALSGGFDVTPATPSGQQASQQSSDDDGLVDVDLGNAGEAKVEATKTINNKQYAKINGKWYEQ